ncbi:MAG: MmcQ/YjbR family DNA-binding protein [Bacteroidales bacterium]|jgi:predicted DNA-binding protein (MmcQ/YjbR family)|nr:MmcQ/YjbR family DNA-binding protein [Bacteroidales bacterium]
MINIEDFRNYCLAKKGVTEAFPFDESTLVFKVMGKMFALTDTEEAFRINLKCEPEKAVILREQYPGTVLPGYHMNKKHWNLIIINGKIPDPQILQWVDDSYRLVCEKLTKEQQQVLKKM